MKYLKIYENFGGKTLNDYLNEKYGKESLLDRTDMNVTRSHITSLEGIERICNATTVNIGHNPIGNLKGIEVLHRVRKLYCWENDLNSLEGIENLTTINLLSCFGNNLTSLKGIENLANLEILFCFSNQLKNIDEIRKLPILRVLECDIGQNEYENVEGNPWESPLPPDLVKKFNIRYANSNIERLGSYKFQENFLEEHPEKVMDLAPIGFHEKIQEKYGDLISFFSK